MQRTYRSKKDTGGGLDHRDVILNMDEKSSAFDAFYIQNIKQTKRDLSSIGSSNQYGVNSNKVRKRKYVKRTKDVVIVNESIRRKNLSRSAYLTPDRSIRVNKPLDPFDMLLNSTPTCHVQYENKNKPIFDIVLPKKRQAKTYTKRKLTKATKHNYSSHESLDFDKENSKEQENTTNDTTDIRTHELLIEQAPSISPKNIDKSINNIVNNLSLLNHLKKTSSNDSFNTPFRFNRNKLTKNMNSPIMQKSPLCSTPFKEKYRSVSIYKFSPISIRNNEDSSTYEKVIDDKEIGSNINKEYVNHDDTQSSSVLYSDNNYSDLIKETNKITPVDMVQDPKDSIIQIVQVHNEAKDHTSVDLLNNTKTLSSIDISTFQNTEMDPFLGFSINPKDVILMEAKKTEFKNIIDDHFENITEVEVNKNNIRKKSSEIPYTNEVNNKKDDDISLSSKDSDKESLYDTCNSEEFPEDNRVFYKEPVIRIERMNDSKFIKYYKKNIHKENDTPENNSSNDDEHSRDSDVSNKSNKSSNIDSDFEKTECSNQGTNSSTNEYIISSNDDCVHVNNEEETCVSFVTTRRRNEVTNNSMISLFENSYGSKISNALDNNEQSNAKNNSNNNSDISICENNQVIPPDFKENICMNDDKRLSISVKKYSNIRKRDTISRNIKSSSNRKTRKSDRSEVTRNAISSYELDSDDDSLPDSDNSVTRTKRKSSIARRRSTKIYRKSITSNIKESSSSADFDKFSYHYVQNNNDENTCDNDSSENNAEKNSVNNDTVISVMKRKTSQVSRKSNLTRDSKRSSNTRDDDCISDSLKDDRDNEVTLYSFPPDILNCSSVNKKRMSSITTRRKSRLFRKSAIISKPQSSMKISDVRFDLSSQAQDIQTDSNEITSSENTNTDSEEISMSNENDPILQNSSNSGYNHITLRQSNVQNMERSMKTEDLKPVIVLQPGKKWERSLSIYRRMTMINQFESSILDESIHTKGRRYRQSVISTMEMQESKGSLHNASINSRRSTFVSKPNRSTIRIVKEPINNRVSLCTTALFDDLKGFLNDDCDDTIVELSKLSIADAEPEITVLELHDTSSRLATARDYVLRRCNQTDVILFDELYPDAVLKNCHKIGEGVYGEVFLWRARDGRARVMKIVPVAGHIKVNGETQKDFQEIISEIVIAMELSALRAPIADIERHFDEGKDVEALDLHTVENATDVFNEVLAVRCVFGGYPSRLLDLWDLYDECKGSDNDNPAILPVDQQYIVLELANAGQDLESYQFNNAEQAHALFLQVAFGLAVGEEAYQFEHRDLHWGNVLIAPTDQKFATFVIRGRAHRVARCGVAATIIDYSLSRLSLPLAACAQAASLYNDLGADDGLFDAVGDYQFEVYRLMRDKLGNDWKNFEPYTNILWLHYTVDKMITALRYKRTNTKIHKHYIDKLKSIKNRILDYKSAADFVLTDNEY